MLIIRFGLLYQEYTEQIMSGIDCQGSLLMRSYKTKQNDRVIS